MASLLSSASSWALTRLMKVALKRNLKHVFATEIDVDQLEVGGGALALKELVLSLAWLNSQLAGSGWAAAAGFVGSVSLRLPLAALTTLSCQVELCDVLLTLRPCAPVPSLPPAGTGAAARPGSAAEDAAWAGAAEPRAQDAAVAEGIRVVAAGLEAMLQRLRASLSRLVVRLEVPAADAAAPAAGSGGGSGHGGDSPPAVHVITLQLERLDYGPAAEGGESSGASMGVEPEGGGALRVRKSVSFSGLNLQLQPAGGCAAGTAAAPASTAAAAGGTAATAEQLAPVLSGEGGGAAGRLDISVAWQLEGSRSVAATAELEPLHLQLWPAHLAALASMAAALGQRTPVSAPAAAPAVAVGAAARGPAPPPLQPLPQPTSMGEVPWGAQSLLDSLLLPDCERVVSESLYSGQEEVDEFFDARSLLGSLQSSFSEHDLDAASLHQAHALAVSVHRTPHPPAPRERLLLRLRAPELSASVLYSAGADEGLGHRGFKPQLVLEVSGLDVEAQRSGGSGSTGSGSGGGGSSGSGPLELAVYACHLEVSEHLPFPCSSSSSSGGESAGSAAAGTQLQMPEEMGRVPEVLPRLKRGRASPSAAGDYPLPCGGVTACGSSTAGLSALGQQSLASTVFESALCHTGGAIPRVQIVPVLTCGDSAGNPSAGSGGGLSLLASLPPAGAGSLSLAAVLPPITLWLAQPLADRVEGLVAGVLSRLPGGTAGDGPGQEQRQAQKQGVQQRSAADGSSRAGAVAAASEERRRASVDEIVQELQDLGRPLPASASSSLEARVFTPSVTLIATVPLSEAAAGATPIRYVALDMTGDERLPAAQRGVAGARDVLAMLEEERVPPLLAAHQLPAPAAVGSSSGQGSGCDAAAAAPASWTASVTAASGAAYAVGSLLASGLHHSVLGGLYAETLARATGSSCSGGGSSTFSIDVAWEPGRRPAVTPSLGAAWEHVSGRAPAALDVMRLRDECFRGSALSITVRSPVVSSHLSRPTVEALLQLSDAILVQLSPSEPVAMPAIQTSLLLECSLDCELQPAGPGPRDSLAIVAGGVQCFVCSGPGGRQGAGVLVLSADALRIEHGEQQALSGVAGSRGEPCLEVLRLARPAGQPFVAGGRLQVPTEARVSATLRGCTAALDPQGLGMGWAESMAAFFAPPEQVNAGAAAAPAEHQQQPMAAAAAAGSADRSASSGSTGATVHLRQVALQRCAVGKQPRGAVPAVLLLGEMSWRAAAGGEDSRGSSSSGGGGHELLLRDLSLHVAKPAADEGRQQPAGLASLDLLSAAGFSQVLSEPSARVLLCGAGPEGSSVEVENTQLTLTLSQRTAGLVQALAAQVQQQWRPAGSSGAGGGGSSRDNGRGGGGGWQDSDLQASVLLEGGWYEDVGREPLTPPGSPPAMVEHPFAQRQSPSDGEDEADGRWLAAEGAPDLQEAYLAAPEEAALRRPSAAALLGPPPSWPQPASIVRLRNIKATIILADTLTTILVPSDSDSDEGSPRGGGRAGGNVSHSSVGGSSSMETAPAASEVQVLVSGLSATLANFDPASDPGQRRLRRLALALGDLEIRDSVRAIGSSRPRAWRRMLGFHASATVPRDPDASLLSLVVETSGSSDQGSSSGGRGAEPRHGVSLALLPLRLQLDQHSVAFLQAFGEGLEAGAAAAASGAAQLQQQQPADPVPQPPVQVECLEIAPFVLTLDYKPRQVDVAALARGHLVEALNLVPFGGVSLCFRHMRVYGMEADASAAAVVAAYLSDIVQHQAHKFVRGVAPIRSLANIGLSTQELLAIPAEALFSRQRQEAGGGRTLLSQLSDRDFRRSLRRGVANLARAVAIEAMNLTATAGGAAASALDSATYRAGREQPAGVREAVRAAGRQVSSGFRSGSAKKAAAAAAGAARTLSLGARNALDPDRYAERQLNM